MAENTSNLKIISLNRVYTEKTHQDTQYQTSNEPINNINSILNKINKMSDENLIKIPNKKEKENEKNTKNYNNQEIITENIIKEEEDNNEKLVIKNNNKSEKKTNKNKRIDKFGNQIKKGGKHKVTFIDNESSLRFYEIINVESFKEFNKMEEVSKSREKVTCCIIM